MFRFLFKKQIAELENKALELEDLRAELMTKAFKLKERSKNIALEEQKIQDIYQSIEKEKECLKSDKNKLIYNIKVFSKKREALKEEKTKFYDLKYKLKERLNNQFSFLAEWENTINEKLEHITNLSEEVKAKEKQIKEKEVKPIERKQKPSEKVFNVRGKEMLLDKHGNFVGFKN